MTGKVYLRGRDGAPIGPVSDQALDVLYGARVIDDSTPISTDGAGFVRLGASSELFLRAERARAEMLDGRDPWRRTSISVPAAGIVESLGDTSAVQALFARAVSKLKGKVVFESDEGRARLSMVDGKIVAVDTDISRLGLGAFLLIHKLVEAEDLEVAEGALGSYGGDLGGALIGLGLVQPHVYVERYAEWAKTIIADVLAWTDGTVSSIPTEVPNPGIPLGLDRFASLVEATRRALDRPRLIQRLQSRWICPVIPSSVDGVTLDELRLPPKDLRIVKGLDGSKTLAEIAEKPGNESALATLYVILETGFARSGEDPQRPKDLEEAKKAVADAAGMKKKSPMEILGIQPESTDEEVRARYMTLAKQYHPDGLRQGSAPELVEARRNLFAALQSVYEAVDSPEKREEFRVMATMGVSNKAEEQAIVRSVLEAETLFKKAEILLRMKKYGEALELIEQALARKPDDIEFRILRVYLRFHAIKLDPATAIKEITAELKKQPNIVAGYLFMARLQKAAGDMDACMKSYKKLLTFDEKNHEAAQEIRLYTMRQEKQTKKKWMP